MGARWPSWLRPGSPSIVLVAKTKAKPSLIVGGVPEHYNYPWHMVLESNSYDALPVRFSWFDTLGGTGEAKAMLEAGELDLAVALTEGMVAAIAAGNPSVILRTYVSTPLPWGVHVPANSDLYEMADLPGHRFAISRFGSGSHLMAHVLADSIGFALTTEDFVTVGNLDGARRAMAAGEAKIFLWDRSMTSPYVQSGEFRRLGTQPTPWPAFVVVGRAEVVAEHRHAIDSLLDAVSGAARELVANENRVQIVAERYGIDADEVTSWFGETTWDCAAPADLEMIKTTRDHLVALGLISGPQPA